MVIGNGFFADSIGSAIDEMCKRAGCEVRHLPYPTVGNIDYWLSINGTLFGVQKVAQRFIVRQKATNKYKSGYVLRLSKAAHKEEWVPLALALYNTFVTGNWAEQKLEFRNGNVYDARLSNIQPAAKSTPPEYVEHMKSLQKIYKSQFNKVADYCNYTTGIDHEDAKDVVQNTFIYLCTKGYNKKVYMNEDFIGLWKKVSRLRSIDFLHHRWMHEPDYDFERYDGSIPNRFEFDLTERLPGTKPRDYLRLSMLGYTRTEIAEELGVSASTVSSSNTRSIQFLQRYLRNERNF